MRGTLGASVQGLLVIYFTPVDPEHLSDIACIQGLLMVNTRLLEAGLPSNCLPLLSQEEAEGLGFRV